MGEISKLKEYAQENHVPIMKDEGIAFICETIRTQSIKRILEIGTAIGYSAISFAQASPDVTVTTIERDNHMYEEAIQNIASMHLEDRITVIHEDALNLSLTGTYDLIFIDAAKSQYIKFFEKYSPLLAEDGVIITDNLSFHGMVEDITLTHNRNTRQLVGKIKQYIEYLKTNSQFETVFYSLGDGISVTKRKKSSEK